MPTDPTPTLQSESTAAPPRGRLSDAEWMARMKQAMERAPAKPRRAAPTRPVSQAAPATEREADEAPESPLRRLIHAMSVVVVVASAAVFVYALYLLSSRRDPALGIVLAVYAFGPLLVGLIVMLLSSRKRSTETREELIETLMDKLINFFLR